MDSKDEVETEEIDICALMMSEGWRHTGQRTYVKIEKGATMMATPPAARMRRIVTRDVDSGSA